MILRLVSEVIWRTIEQNPWHSPSGGADQGVANIKADMDSWYDAACIPAKRRVADLTKGMLGKRKLATIKTKAAETATLLPFAIHLCRIYPAIRNADSLLAAGNALQDYLRLLDETPPQVPQFVCQQLLDFCIRHLRLMMHANVQLLPKHHLWCHLTIRIKDAGNPRCYSTFLDESLNKVLANMASASHRARWEERTFFRVQLLPEVQSQSWFVAAKL